jgi:hydroxymethylglutaryl-CoA lyase
MIFPEKVKLVEARSFVSTRRVPQMADSAQALSVILWQPGTSYPVLAPNLTAIAAGAEEIAIFVSASGGFSRNNIACSRIESISRLTDVVDLARARGMKIRSYISCIAGCPYEGDVPAAEELVAMGCYETSLGDTIGVGTASQIRNIIDHVATEDVLYLLRRLGIETGVDLTAVVKTGAWIRARFDRPNASRAGRALLAEREAGV